ncbi:NYN domain-containing protein [Pseudoduganella lurida]|uniref:NYN domain-containing protein n=1 Tax=Pseudoduganella lurida TaxID=1036180 RepID=A0A562QX54_9BURK|nr:NYN domain-containing protein [Pseudoduganella lurida]TWI60800.1 NYN domain-containing protein [Pseudoduganella lurida]
MASSNDNVSMALFCDFENVALGVRDANYEKFDIKPVLERLLLKGSIVVKKAYCDWDRYKAFKGSMHEANFELIEIPHVRISGKNSADIRMVVDALDLCYTKAHVNTFVIISGDSDFSPLVSKLRENNKKVIGVGVKDSTSDLLVANCDEFIFYDDLVRESRRQRRDVRDQQQAPKRSPEEEKKKREEGDKRRTEAVDIAFETFDALITERGDSGKIWASVLKEAIKRRKPDFNEAYYGFRTFGNLLEEMKARGLLEFGRDEKSGAYVYRSSSAAAQAAAAEQSDSDVTAVEPVAAAPAHAPSQDGAEKGRRGRGNRGGRNRRNGPEAVENAAPQEVAEEVSGQSNDREEDDEPNVRPQNERELDDATPATADLEDDEVAVALESAAADYAAELASAEQALEEMAREVRETRRARAAAAQPTIAEQLAALPQDDEPAAEAPVAEAAEPAEEAEPADAAPAKRSRTGARKTAAAKKPARTSKVAKAAADAAEAVDAVLATQPVAEAPEAATEVVTEAATGAEPEAPAVPAKKARARTPSRSSLPRKPKAKPQGDSEG